MAEAKTRPTTASVPKYFAALTPAERRADCETISEMFEKATKEKPVLWGDAIIGYGNEPIVYADGSTMDWPVAAFASRAQDIVLYGMRSADNFQAQLKAIAPAKLKGGCVHIKRLSDVDTKALQALIISAVNGKLQKAKASKEAKAAKATKPAKAKEPKAKVAKTTAAKKPAAKAKSASKKR